MADSGVPQPPEPPQVARRFTPATSQLIGVGAVLAIVLLALFEVFGVVHAEASAEQAPLRIQTRYPERLRYKTTDILDVQITNTGTAVLEAVAVRFARSYLDAFANVTLTPTVGNVTDEAYEVLLADVQPGETRRVTAEIQGEDYWRHTGFVEVSVPDATARTELATLVFP